MSNVNTDRLKCLLLNARSLKSVNTQRNKLVEFQSLVSLQNINLACVTETWLNSTVQNNEILSGEQFNIYRKDRRDGYGGIMLAVDMLMRSKRMKNLELANLDHNEIMVIELKPKRQSKIAIVVTYRPPDDVSDEYLDNFRNVLKNVENSRYKNICIMGDFNLPNFDWTTGVPFNNLNRAYDFYEVFQEHGLVQLVKEPTHVNGNTLDLVLSNFPNRFNSITVEEDAFSSDHYPIEFDIRIKIKPVKAVQAKVFDFKNADWNKLNTELLDCKLEDCVQENAGDVDIASDAWHTKVKNVIDRVLTTKRVKNINSPPWIDNEIQSKSKKKFSLWKKAKRIKSLEAWANYRKERNELRNLVNLKYNNFIQSSTEKIAQNPKVFWKIVKSKNKTKNVPDRLTHERKYFSTTKDRAKAFNDYFYSVFINESHVEDDLPVIDEFVNLDLCNIYIEKEEVEKLLKEVNASKAGGPDEIPGRILKECSMSLAPSLTMIFNLSLQTGKFPNCWKFANVVPVFKKGEREEVTNYRPVSLLGIISKIFEKCIHHRVYEGVKDLIHSLQHGFLKGRCTVTQLMEVFNTVEKCLDEGGQMDIIYLDFAKAFDTVSHRLLCHKLKSFGINGRLLEWFESYLSNRKQRVVLEGIQSEWKNVHSGVPQGSILGPLLFLLYANDMANEVSDKTAVAMYADDTKVMRNIVSVNDSIELQRDLDNMGVWSRKWRMKFNVAKCKLLMVTRKDRPIDINYTMNEQVLEKVYSFNDLGIVIDSKLNWQEHVRNKVGKANGTMGLVKRTLGFKAPMRAKKLLYESLVKSSLCYGSVIWNGASKMNLKLIEGVQRRATKYISGNYEMDYKGRLEECDLLPLSFTFEYHDIVFFYKCYHKWFNYDINRIFRVRNSNTRLNKGIIIDGSFARTETFKRFYSNRVVDIWNMLPIEIRNVTCTNKKVVTLKLQVKKWFEQKRENQFNVDDTCSWVSKCRCHRCRQV